MIKSRNKVINSDENTDTEIARCALHVVETGRRVNLVADDTDVALLLLYHWKSCMVNIAFTSDKSKATFDISFSISEMPDNIKPYLLVLHAWTSCDTTSAIHSKGKTSLTKKLETSQHHRGLIDVLSDRNARQAEVSDGGIHLFLYICRKNQALSKLQYGYFLYLTL